MCSQVPSVEWPSRTEPETILALLTYYIYKQALATCLLHVGMSKKLVSITYNCFIRKKNSLGIIKHIKQQRLIGDSVGTEKKKKAALECSQKECKIVAMPGLSIKMFTSHVQYPPEFDY